jgi:hypothetical protein
MSNSIFVPVLQLPSGVDEVRKVIHQSFDEFNLPRPDVQLHQPNDPQKSLRDSIVTVRGAREHEHCWVSFGEYPADLTGTDASAHMADVTTRGSWLFAAVVVLALFEFHGTVAFNDSGELDGQAAYDEATLRQVIGSALDSGKQYLAR